MRAQSEYRIRRAEAERKNRVMRGLASVVLFLVLLAGGALWCGWNPFAGATNAAETDSTAQTQSAVTEKQQVTDWEGRTVEVPVDPQHVAVLDSFSGELAVMLGAGDELLGVPGGVSSDSILCTIYPELSGLTQLSGNTVNIEELVNQGCDLALVKTSLSEEEREKLDRVGIPYVVVGYETLDDQLNAMELVAQVLGPDAQQACQKIRASYDEMINIVETRTAQIDPADYLRVYHSINDALLCDAADSLGADWLLRAGCVSVSATENPTSGSDYTATLEQIYTWNPDAVVCSVATTAADIQADTQWNGMAAVAAGRVYNLPIGATRWGQRGSVETPLAMLWAGVTFYPDLYADVDMKELVVSYYQDCLGVQMDDALYNQVLSGEGIRVTGSGNGTGTGSGKGM